MTVKYVRVSDVFPQKVGNACVYPHHNSKNRRKHACVTTSESECMRKRVCVKNVFFVFPPNALSDSFKTFHNQNKTDVVEYTCMANMHVPAWTTAKGNMVMFLP